MSNPETMRALRLDHYGEASQALALEQIPLPTLEPNKLLIKVEAIPLNLNDIERINGGNMMVRPEFPYSPGMEVMGTVVDAGEGAETLIGKRVNAFTEAAHGGYAEYCVVPAASAFEALPELAAEQAAAMFFPFHLAYLGLKDRARLQAGETVLIHAAAGGSGSMALQLAKALGATVIASASSEEKLALCRQLGADHVVNYRDSDFASTVLELTEGKGADVIFDNVGDAVLEASLKCLAYNGRYLMMGFASNKASADEKLLVPRQMALANAGVFGVTLAYAEAAMADMLKQAMGWNFASRELGDRVQAAMLDFYQAGHIQPVLGATIDFEDIPVWIERLARGETSGRVVALLN